MSGGDDDDRLCVVCLESARETAFYPCHHTVCCAVCAALLKSCDDPCPFCREPITSWVMGSFKDARVAATVVRHTILSHADAVSSDEDDARTPASAPRTPPGAAALRPQSSVSRPGSGVSRPQSGHFRPPSGAPHPTNTCALCSESPPEVTLLPCGHQPCCAVCTTVLKDDRRPCPVCLKPFTSCKLIQSPPPGSPPPSRHVANGTPDPIRRGPVTPARTSGESPNQRATKFCVSCLGPSPELTLKPCGHRVCIVCGTIIKDRRDHCPACNATVTGFSQSDTVSASGSPPARSSPKAAALATIPRAPMATMLASTVSKRLLYPTLGTRFFSTEPVDYVVTVTPGFRVQVSTLGGPVLLLGKGQMTLAAGYNYKFYAPVRRGDGPAELALQLKARGGFSTGVYYELLTPPPKFTLATCKGYVSRTRLSAHVYPRNLQTGPFLYEIGGLLDEGWFNVKGPSGEVMGHITKGVSQAAQITIGVLVPAHGDALLLFMLAVLCTCLTSDDAQNSNRLPPFL